MNHMHLKHGSWRYKWQFTDLHKATVREHCEQGVDMRLRGEVKPGAHVSARGAHPAAVTRVQSEQV